VVVVIITDKILEVSGGHVNLFVSDHGLGLLGLVPCAPATVQVLMSEWDVLFGV